VAEWLRSGLQSRLWPYHDIVFSTATAENSGFFTQSPAPLSYPVSPRTGWFGGNLGGKNPSCQNAASRRVVGRETANRSEAPVSD